MTEKLGVTEKEPAFGQKTLDRTELDYPLLELAKINPNHPTHFNIIQTASFVE